MATATSDPPRRDAPSLSGPPSPSLHAPALAADGLVKWFWAAGKKVSAVDGVSLTVRRGEIYALLGANGSGKSTLLRVLSTELEADDGTIRVFGLDLRQDALAAKRLITHVSVEASPSEKLPADAQTEPLLRPSRGHKQKIAIARAFLTEPSLLLLDEPTTGLDLRNKREVQTLVRDHRDEHDATIVLATHDLDEAERLADRVGILHRGRLVAEGTAGEIAARYGSRSGLEEAFMVVSGRSRRPSAE